ncbi:unnamed protein product, partial [Ectocarpus fasciculatus]
STLVLRTASIRPRYTALGPAVTEEPKAVAGLFLVCGLVCYCRACFCLSLSASLSPPLSLPPPISPSGRLFIPHILSSYAFGASAVCVSSVPRIPLYRITVTVPSRIR